MFSKRSNPDLEPAFFSRSPATFRYANSPLRTIKNPQEIEQFSQEDFAKKLNIAWADSILLSPFLRNLVWQDKTYPKTAITEIEDRLHHPLDCFVVCKMGPFGHGLFHALDAKPLPVGTIIGIYSGILRERTLQGEDYSMSARETEHQSSVIRAKLNVPSFFQDTHGGFTRFIQDLPDEDELKKITNATPLQLSNVVTANLVVLPTVYCGTPVSYLMTVKEIKPGDQYGFSYGGRFTFQGKKRAIFDVEGNHIGYFESKDRLKFLDTFKPSLEKRVPEIDRALARTKLEPIVMRPNLEGFDYEKRFIGNLKYCLDIYINRPNPAEIVEQKLFELQEIIYSNQRYIQIYTQLKAKLADKQFEDPTLNILKKELLFHMKKFAEVVLNKQNTQPKKQSEDELRQGEDFRMR